MPIKRITLNGRIIHSLDDFYDQLAPQLHLPDYFGRNLDALWDVLSTDVEGAFEITWKHADDSRKFMGMDFSRALKVLQQLEKARKDFRVIVES